jgi:hypothetical protein
LQNCAERYGSRPSCIYALHESLSSLRAVFVVHQYYVATPNGLSISNDGGDSFLNKTTTGGVASNAATQVYVIVQ